MLRADHKIRPPCAFTIIPTFYQKTEPIFPHSVFKLLNNTTRQNPVSRLIQPLAKHPYYYPSSIPVYCFPLFFYYIGVLSPIDENCPCFRIHRFFLWIECFIAPFSSPFVSLKLKAKYSHTRAPLFFLIPILFTFFFFPTPEKCLVQ